MNVVNEQQLAALNIQLPYCSSWQQSSNSNVKPGGGACLSSTNGSSPYQGGGCKPACCHSLCHREHLQCLQSSGSLS